MSLHKPKNTIWSRYGYLWVTFGIFVFSLVGHWLFGWYAYVNEQTQVGRSPEVGGFVVQTLRDTLENWQSECLQLIWQVAGLAFLFHIGSPSSKEGIDRIEEKVDRILHAVDSDAAQEIEKIDRIYQRA